MKQKIQYIMLICACMAIAVLAGMLYLTNGLPDKDVVAQGGAVFDVELQTSEFQWNGPIDEVYLKLMCDKSGIDYHMDRPTLGYRIECPKCKPGWCPPWDPNSHEEGTGGAFYEHQADGRQTFFRFLASWPEIEVIKAGESVLIESEDSRVYCAKCGYPVGTDWRVVDLDPNTEPTFDDLLDAMIDVESGGNEIAIGVGGERGILQLSEIYIDDVNRIRGPSLATGRDIYEYADAFDLLLSRIMAKTYLKYYLNYAAKDKPLEMRSFEMAARIHNGGPDGWKKESTKPYWEKVKARLYNE